MTLAKELNHAALLVIDMQNAYFNNAALANRREDLVKRCNELIDIATAKNIPIIFVRTLHKRDKSTWTNNMLDDGGGYLFDGDEDAEYVDGLHVDGTNELTKTRDSAFYQTELLDRLRALNVDTMILAGVSTHACILYTAADAYAANLRVLLAADAIASHDPSYHDTTLEMLRQEYRQKIINNSDLR